MITIITEKPSAAENFANALGGMKGSFEGSAYEIVSSQGHLFQLVTPEHQVREELAGRYKYWKLENLPWEKEDILWRKALNPKTRQIFENIRAHLMHADEAVIATDDDPSGEGQMIGWEIISHAGYHGRVSRMYFVDESAKEIQKAFRERRTLPPMESDGEYLKAMTRQRYDYLTQQDTRIPTILARQNNMNILVRVGRLKGAIMKLVGDQWKAYGSYVKKPFFEVRYKDEKGNAFSREDNDERYDSRDDVPIDGFSCSEVVIDSVTVKHASPPRLLDLLGISSILASQGIDPGTVQATYQRLYEAHYVSYPRTEDKMISPEQFNKLRENAPLIASAAGIDPALLTHTEARKTHVRQGGSHGANRPGSRVPESLDDLQKYGPGAAEIYELLARNSLAMLCEDYEYLQQKGHLKEYPEFTATASIPQSQGFRAVYDDDERKEEASAGLGLHASPFVYEGANKSPSRPTIKWLRDKLDKYNVGTGATRTSTIAEISSGRDDRRLIDERKGILSMTPVGDYCHRIISGCMIADVETTEKLFSDMEKVGHFEMTPEEVLDGFTPMLLRDLETMKANAKKTGHVTKIAADEDHAIGPCPKCGRKIVYRKREDGSYSYYHEDFKTTSCDFVLSGTQRYYGNSITISPSAAGKLLSGGRIRVNGLERKSGGSYDAYLRLRVNGKYGNLEFDGFPRKKSSQGPASRS